MNKIIAVSMALAVAACNPNNNPTNEPNLNPIPAQDEAHPTDPMVPEHPVTGADQADRADAVPGDDVHPENPPFDQSEAPEDVKTTAAVRRAVIDAEDLSVRADNVQIVTRGGAVRLSGAVETPEEKARLEEIAKGVAGVVSVDNQLTVDLNDREDVREDQVDDEPGQLDD
ncbi:MAG: BON domain-containing protein [Myxococcota bacterium]